MSTVGRDAEAPAGMPVPTGRVGLGMVVVRELVSHTRGCADQGCQGRAGAVDKEFATEPTLGTPRRAVARMPAG